MYMNICIYIYKYMPNTHTQTHTDTQTHRHTDTCITVLTYRFSPQHRGLVSAAGAEV